MIWLKKLHDLCDLKFFDFYGDKTFQGAKWKI